jgi:hypothetical protein
LNFQYENDVGTVFLENLDAILLKTGGRRCLKFTIFATVPQNEFCKIPQASDTDKLGTTPNKRLFSNVLSVSVPKNGTRWEQVEIVANSFFGTVEKVEKKKFACFGAKSRSDS